MNQLYWGDNLEALRGLSNESVDLICTDSPFNTGKDWGAFNDKWEGGLEEYLGFMEARAVEMRRVLKDTGSLYLHCDPTASHYLKVMLDGVFGVKQFQNEIVWSYQRWTNTTKHFQRMHDSILFYSKDVQLSYFYPLTEPYSTKSAHKSKRTTDIVDGVKKSVYTDDFSRKKPMRDVWEISYVNPMAKDKTGYPTQKPVALYERMIQASSNQHDIVLDPFAGSGTTLDAAQSLKRNWIGIDQGSEAIETTTKRLANEHGLLPDRDYELIGDKSKLNIPKTASAIQTSLF